MKKSLDQDIDYLEKSYNIKSRQNTKKKSIFKHGNLLSYKIKDKIQDTLQDTLNKILCFYS